MREARQRGECGPRGEGRASANVADATHGDEVTKAGGQQEAELPRAHTQSRIELRDGGEFEMGARCVFCEKQKQIEGTRGDHDALVLYMHRCVVNQCAMFQPKAHDLVHTYGHDPAIRGGRV